MSPGFVPPRQARSRDTLDAIIEATEALLDRKPFEAISVQEITTAAGCSTGSFYARFPAKDDLIPHLYARFDDELAARIESLDAARDWSRMSLADMVSLFVAEHIGSYAAKPNLLREVTHYVRRLGSQPPSGTGRRNRLFQRAIDRLAAARTASGQPVGPMAATFALSAIGQVVREAVLFGNLPLAEPGRLGHEELQRELTAMALAYLEARA